MLLIAIVSFLSGAAVMFFLVLLWSLLAASSQTTPREEDRSEEHTSELQSQSNLVCRLLLEKKKKNNIKISRFSKIKNVRLNSLLINLITNPLTLTRFKLEMKLMSYVHLLTISLFGYLLNM